MKNSTAIAMKVLAWIVLIGGLILGILSIGSAFFEVALPCFGIAIAGFILLRGFAEVIHLLDKISWNTDSRNRDE